MKEASSNGFERFERIGNYSSTTPTDWLVDESPIAMYTCDKNGYLTFYNKAATQIWGRTPNIGSDLWFNFWEIYYPNGTKMPFEESPMAKVLKEVTNISQAEIIVETPDHAFRRLLVFPRAILNEDGVLEGAHNTLVDITAIETRQSFLSAIVDSSDDAIISKNLDGIITSWNVGAQRIFGYKEEEVLGKSITILIPPSRLEEEDLILSKIRSGNKVDHFQTLRISKSGKTIPISLTVSPIKNHNGQIVGASKIARDISGSVEAQRAIMEYANNLEILNSVSKSISEKLDIQRILYHVLNATTKLTGADVSGFLYNITDKNAAPFMLYTSLKDGKETVEKTQMSEYTSLFGSTFSKDKTIRLDDITIHKDQQHTPLHYILPKEHVPISSYLAVPVVSSKGTIGGLFFGHAEPAKFSIKLEDLISNIAAQAAIALDNTRLFEEVKELNIKKDEFIALASHELKTPLTTINGYLQIIGKQESDLISKKFIDKALKQLAKLNKLVSDLLDVSKIAVGKLDFDFELWDLKELVDDVIETFHYANNTHRIYFNAPETELMIKVDRHRIEQVVNNLLSNALKYSPHADKVFVSIAKNSDKLTVKIKDEGIGLTEEQKKKIFSRFYRAEGTSKIAGLGIGLYLTKEIVIRHGGNIGVKSEFGKGSEFYFTLPLTK